MMKHYLAGILAVAFFQLGAAGIAWPQDVPSGPGDTPEAAMPGVQSAEEPVPDSDRGIVEAASENLWPELSRLEWFWHVPNENLSEKQAKAAVSGADSGFYYSSSSVNGQLRGVEVSRKWLRFEFFYNGSDALQSIPMKIFNGIGGLFYATNQQPGQKWCVTIMLNTTSSANQVYFKTEAQARSFIDAALSCAKLAGQKIEKPGALGFRFADLTPDQAQALGKDRIDSALVTFVALDGPAEKAALKFLDIITEVNGAKLRHADQLAEILETVSPGAVLKFACLTRTREEGDSGVTYVWKPKNVELVAE